VVEREGKPGPAVVEVVRMNIFFCAHVFPLELLKVFFQIAIDRNTNPLNLLSFTTTLKVGQDIEY